MHAGVRVAVAFVLGEISTLLEKGKEKNVCKGKCIRKRYQLSASTISRLDVSASGDKRIP